MQREEFLAQRIEDLARREEISWRMSNSLTRMNINTVEELTSWTWLDLSSVEGMGKKVLAEIENFLQKNGEELRVVHATRSEEERIQSLMSQVARYLEMAEVTLDMLLDELGIRKSQKE